MGIAHQSISVNWMCEKKSWKHYWLTRTNTTTKGQLFSEWIYEVIVSPKIWTNKKLSGLLPTTQGRNPNNFAFVFWEKWWLHKFILKNNWPLCTYTRVRLLNLIEFMCISLFPIYSKTNLKKILTDLNRLAFSEILNLVQKNW